MLLLHKHKINLNYNGTTVVSFLVNSERGLVRWQVRLIRKFRIGQSLSYLIGMVRIESRSFAGP